MTTNEPLPDAELDRLDSIAAFEESAGRSVLLDPATVRRLVAEVRRLRAIEATATELVKMQEEAGCPTCGGTGVAWDWPDSVDLAAALRPRP